MLAYCAPAQLGTAILLETRGHAPRCGNDMYYCRARAYVFSLSTENHNADALKDRHPKREFSLSFSLHLYIYTYMYLCMYIHICVRESGLILNINLYVAY